VTGLLGDDKPGGSAGGMLNRGSLALVFTDEVVTGLVGTFGVGDGVKKRLLLGEEVDCDTVGQLGVGRFTFKETTKGFFETLDGGILDFGDEIIEETRREGMDDGRE